MYEQSDPRASLAPSAAPVAATSFAPAEYGLFDRTPPAEADAQGRSWYLRGQNFVLNYIEAVEGGRFPRHAQPDEYALILPDPNMAIEVSAGGETVAVRGGSVVFVPAGYSLVRATAAGRIVRLLTARSADLAAKCANAESYREPHPNIPPFVPWPAAESAKIRVYPLEVPATPGRFGSIYRCSTFMINAIERYEGPRDTARLSPHHHDDFEQCSLAVEGSFVHHIRWPWTPNLAAWRTDEHAHCGSPSAVVIPPPAIHTSRAMDPGTNRLIDIFCPPRLDFSSKEGWVLNAGDYPMPETS
jgi:mannose-6-phosphate isomerase-like protein (cupin superfamily)